jgi:endogenous inhibitor of DNA gyrase (YacG/DUF329 family)
MPMPSSCPICEKPVKPRRENPNFPFCSPRCKTIDLGKWMSEDYRVPVEGEDGEREDVESDPPPKEPVRH